MLNIYKKTDQLALLMAAGYNRLEAERFLQPTNTDYQCRIWSQGDFDFLEVVHGVDLKKVKANEEPGFIYVRYEKNEEYILEVKEKF